MRLHNVRSSSSRWTRLAGRVFGWMTITRSSPARKGNARASTMARIWRFSRLRTTAPLSPRRVRSPTRVTRSLLRAAPTESPEPRAQYPRRYTTLKALVRFSRGFTPSALGLARVARGRTAASGGGELPAAFSSTTLEYSPSAARAHAQEKAVRPRSLEIGLVAKMLFHGSPRFPRSP